MGIIDSPEPGAQVPETVTVRGWVKGTGQRSIWLVARWANNRTHCVGSIRRVVPTANGTFEVELAFLGDLRQRIALIAADGPAATFLEKSRERLAHAASGMSFATRCNPRCEQLGGLDGTRLPAGAVTLASATVHYDDYCAIP